jgi:hypothetical protein
MAGLGDAGQGAAGRIGLLGIHVLEGGGAMRERTAGVYENPDWLCIHKVVHHQCEKCKNPELSRLKDTPPTEMTSLKEIKAMLGQLLEAKEDTVRFRKLMGEENARFWNTFMGALDGLNAGFAQAIGELRKDMFISLAAAHAKLNLLANPPRKRAAKRRKRQ